MAEVMYPFALWAVMVLCATLAQHMQYLKFMIVALATSYARMVSCFGGVELPILDNKEMEVSDA